MDKYETFYKLSLTFIDEYAQPHELVVLLHLCCLIQAHISRESNPKK